MQHIRYIFLICEFMDFLITEISKTYLSIFLIVPRKENTLN